MVLNEAGFVNNEPSVEWTRSGNVATVVFSHRARRNAMTLEMWRRVPVVCAELAEDSEIRVVVLRGAGDGAFVAGADISQFHEHRPGDTAGDTASADGTPDGDGSYDVATESAFAAIGALDKPVLAAIHGFCIGGGLAMAVEADLRFASDDATFGLPPARLGVGYSPDGIATLVDLLGPSRTMELILTGDPIDAERAAQWGLVNEVVAKGELDEVVRRRADVIASRAPLTQRAAKLAVADHLVQRRTSVDQGVIDAIRACAESQDYQEGIRAFLDKRPPRFQGC